MAIVPELAAEGGPALPAGRRRDAVTWTVGASLLAHALVLLVAMIWRGASIPAPEVNIPVELLSPEQYEAETRSANGPPAAAPPTVTPPAIAPPAEPGMIRPTTMLAAAALADPKSRQAREMMPHVDATERTVQLCNLEAMEQVHAWKPSFEPERIVAYAVAPLAIAGDTIRADGAAFLSAGEWYTMRFDCGLSADHASVVSFAFKVGATIPHDQWDADNLPTAN